jgi:hypothetical protein
MKSLVADVRKAVAGLVAAKLILPRRGSDGRTYYQVNRRKLGAIQELLEKKDESSGSDTA